MLDWIKSVGEKTAQNMGANPHSSAANYQGVEVMMNPAIWGPGISSQSRPVTFVFEQGGVGDYINWCTAIEYISKVYTHVDGRIFLSELFMDVAHHLFGHLPRWKIYHKDDMNKYLEPGTSIHHAKPGTQLINACGAHLMDIGQMYFIGTIPIPKEHLHLPVINYEGPWKWPELDPESDFAIFTPGCTSEVREMPVKAFNEIQEYTISKGIKPVYLGKRELSFGYEAKFLHYDFTKGIDLRERTNLLEATQIMRKAKFILGIDNGLLHMSGTTDCPTIFGHNVAALEHRQLRRKEGITVDITVDETELPCIGCQSRMRFMGGHDFRQCFNKKVRPDMNRACLRHLFKNDSAEWKKAIDKVLKWDKRKRK